MEAKPKMSHRAKHRREVKRYLRKKENTALYSETINRDASLFLLNKYVLSANDSDKLCCFLTCPSKQNPPLSCTEWDFEFVCNEDNDRCLLQEDSDSGCTHETAIVPPTFFNDLNSSMPSSSSSESTKTRFVSDLPVNQCSTALASKVASSVHVRRVQGVPAIPVKDPIPYGTDLNKPPRNYLTYDAEYNVHQHAPGFVRDGRMALRSLLVSAVKDWKHASKQNVMLLSTGDVMRSIFEQNYTDDKPLALQIKCLGPTVVIDKHTSFPSSAASLHESALLSKTLYRLKEETEVAANSSAVALQHERISTPLTAQHAGAFHQYSQLLRWDIDALEVLVGVDTPIQLDRRTNTEQMVLLENIAMENSESEQRQKRLSCWFSAMLANVPQVGIYFHRGGVVQKFEVKKRQDLLGLSDVRLATEAMNFTSNVLQWIVRNCVKDNVTYVAFRSYKSNYLELYEVPGMAVGTADQSSNNKDVDHSAAESDKTADYDMFANLHSTSHTDEVEKAHILARLWLNLSNHVYAEGPMEKAKDAVLYLLRSFNLFLEHGSDKDSKVMDEMFSVVQKLPLLIARFVKHECAAAGHSGDAAKGLPGILRETLLLCGCFQMPLTKTAKNPLLSPDKRNAYLRCLVPCSVALCAVVAHALESFNVQRRHCSAAQLRKCITHDKDTDKCASCDPPLLLAKKLLQVAVEGLLRLEQINFFIECWNKKSSDVDSPTRLEAKTGTEKGELVAPSTAATVDTACLHATLCELYGDVVLLTMADETSFTVKALHIITEVIAQRRASHDRGATSTLDWLSKITTDKVASSFTAFRLYTEARSQQKRVLMKTGQVYYFVGESHAAVARYTKALEALHRSRALFKASDEAPADNIVRVGLVYSSLVTPQDVARATGRVYERMARLKRCGQAAEAVLSRAQPLTISPHLCVMSSEEEQLLRRAIDVFTEGELPREKADTLLYYTSRQMDQLTIKGEPTDAGTSRHLYSMLVEAKACDRLWREWELLRLLSCTKAHQRSKQLLKEGRDVAHRWAATATQEPAADSDWQAFSEAHHVCRTQVHLQLALVMCVQIEEHSSMQQRQGRKAEEYIHEAQVVARELLSAIAELPDGSAATEWLTAPTWRSPHPVDFTRHMCSLMLLRTLQAIRPFCARRQQELTAIFEDVIGAEELKKEKAPMELLQLNKNCMDRILLL